jgi:hypothetical protein
MYSRKINKEDHQKIYEMYYNENKTQAEIANIFNVKQSCIWKIMNKNNWISRSQKELAKNRDYTGLQNWRNKNGSWCKGLTKNDPKMKSLIEKGRQTQINNGTSKGKNNPMYGKVTRAVGGHRKDLGHATRSSWEANFARILIFLKLSYDYEKYTFELEEGDTYTPDFYIPLKNKFYEIKGWEKTDKHYRFIKQHPDKKLIIIKEKQYNRLMKKFGGVISVSDSDTTYTKEDIEQLFSKYIKKSNKTNISVYDFQKEIKIGTQTIQQIFGSQKKFKNLFYNEIVEVEMNIIHSEFLNFYNDNFPTCGKKKFIKFFTRASSIINKYYGGKFTNFLKDFYIKNPNLIVADYRNLVKKYLIK